ncbi:MAG: hypothetical protein JRJ40_11320 [Deltaproteobacteria bacterium]|nr:hypothetical protein [Deltaproteobacteria bacterium]
MTPECLCKTCGNTFDESKLTIIRYAEYAGASMQEEYASPCCHGDWDYIEEE